MLGRSEPVAVVIGAVLVWELAARFGLLPPKDFPPATLIARAFLADLRSAELWTGITASLEAWGIGMLIVIALALPAGVLLGSSAITYRLSYLSLEFIRTLPAIAALPILMFTYGVSQQLVVALVVLAGLWPLLIQTMYGMHDVDPIAIASAKVYGIHGWRRFLLVDLRSCLPYIATGLRVSGTFALIFAIAASLIIGGQGLGDAMAQAARIDDRPLLYARVLTCGLLGLCLTLGLAVFERRALCWHSSQRGVAQ
ncbi:ABC-type nitrate/sulfonate/bicarbonate transport system permease component [Rhodococcus rhodochrous J38]|nr:ABC-type nitrate/sulfonate/bicarbonate transport system permease component [Rhodococcus rhodochrous J38]